MRDPYLHFYQVLLLPPVEEHGTQQQQHRKCFLNFHAPPVVQENYASALSLFSPPFQSLLTSTTVDDDDVVV